MHYFHFSALKSDLRRFELDCQQLSFHCWCYLDKSSLYGLHQFDLFNCHLFDSGRLSSGTIAIISRSSTLTLENISDTSELSRRCFNLLLLDDSTLLEDHTNELLRLRSLCK